MPQVKAIIIPLYDHVGKEEVEEIMEQLNRLALAKTPVYQPKLNSDEWICGFTLASLQVEDELTEERMKLAGFSNG